jgi:hypothetical protein
LRYQQLLGIIEATLARGDWTSPLDVGPPALKRAV